MNLDNVKYSWVLLKIKPDGVEVVLNPACEKLTGARLEQAFNVARNELHKLKIRAINNREQANS